MYHPGTIVAGKYRVDYMLGAGGMGFVMAATHLALNSRVALKFLLHEMVRNSAIVERFLREARASAALQSDNACRVSDVGMAEDGTPFMVMELLNGHDLASILKHNGPAPASTVAEWILQACQAIAEAHAIGIVHRDLKPGNLFLTTRPNGRPLIKVLDFGVAKAPADRDFSVTKTSSVMGSPGYMSPEQLKASKNADARSDIWSLGIVMYELITGKQPFHGESITELALKVVMEPVPPMPHNLPRGFVEIVGRCLEKDPARRYQDVAALASALAPFAADGQASATEISRVLRSPLATPAAGVPTTPYTTPTTLRSASGVVEGEPRRGKAAVIAGVVLGGIAIGVVSVVLATGGGDGKSGGDDMVQPASSTTPPPPTPPTPPTTTPPPTTTATTPPPPTTPPPTTPQPESGSATPPESGSATPPESDSDTVASSGSGSATPPKKKPPKKKPTLEDLSGSRK